MPRHQRLAVFFVLLTTSTLATVGSGQVFGRVVRAIGGGGMVQLPYSVNDSAGNNWMIYQTGWIQIQGNQPLYGQGAMLQVNNGQPGMRNNQARLDEKTGEVIFENMNANGYIVTRRILIDKETASARYIDIIRNPQQQDQTVNIQIQSNMNFGINNGQNVNDPRKKENVIGWIGDNQNGRWMVEMFAGKGSKVTPTVNFQQGNTFVQGQFQLSIPAGKEIALMHIHAVANSAEQAGQFVPQLRESRIMAGLSPELRKLIVNFPPGAAFIGEREVLRGELFDVVEIRGGDQMRGTLKEPTFKLATFYGDVELPSDRVVSLINVGEFRPRQLLVTADGEIFGGKLEKQTVELELTSGQVTQIPLTQISRFGYRKRPNEPEEWTFDKPFVSLRSGERVNIEMPSAPIDVVTRYGPLKLDCAAISALVFQAEEHGVHDIQLTDGSHFAGLVNAPEFEMKLAGGGGQVVRFPTSAIARINLVKPSDEVDTDASATMKLSNEDLLVGALAGQLKLDTAFDTLTLNAGEIRKLTRAKEGATDVTVQLWDQSVVSGQLQDPSLQCRLGSGVTVGIPVALLSEYNQPQPQPAPSMVEKIKAAAAQLNAEDWKVRDKAEADLTAMGSVVVSVLKEIRPSQPPEAQQRIDQILANVAKKK